jgi:hypothetical protein
MILISLSLFRSLYVNLFQYSQIRGRLTDQLTAPILLNLIVIGTSSTVFVVLYFAEVGIEILLFSYFALPPIMFLYSSYRQVKGNLSIRFSSGNEWKFLKACIVFSVPAALNTLLVIGFSNLTKVYVLNVFGEDEMVRYVFSFRIAMIIQLCHMVVSGYSYKFFLLSQDYKKMMKYYSAYSMSLVAISLLIVLFIVLLDSFSNSEFTKVDLLLVCSFGYTLFWCFSSFFDFLYIRIGKTKLMLVNSIVFFLTYILFYGISGISNPTDAAIGLFFSSTAMFISNLVIIWCHRDSIIQVE